MTTTSRAPALLVLVLLAVVALSGCTSGGVSSTAGSSGTPVATTPAAHGYQRYVALGDSYSAGPLIPTTDLAGGCARSDHNYPSLLSARLHVEDLVDVTCSGATTHDLAHVQRPFADARIPPQLRAVTAQTDLVTVGIGGNDLGLFVRLVHTCTRLGASDPTGSPCTRAIAANGPDLTKATATISDRVAASLRAVRKRAPRATIILVGYLRLVPESGTCRQLPLATGDYAEGRRISAALDRALARAASRTKVTYVDMDGASRGHDICSAHPWVNGQVTDRQRALAYHPFEAGMRATAAAVLDALER